MSKRELTNHEIEDILSFITVNPLVPKDVGIAIAQQSKTVFMKQLKGIKIYPEIIPALKQNIIKTYQKSLIHPGECVGIVTAQSIGETQTQANLNTFHKAGSADKQPVVSKFSELLNATTVPKNPSYTVHLTQGNDTIQSVRNTLNSSIVELTVGKIIKNVQIHLEKEEEEWYEPFYDIYGKNAQDYSSCISFHINMDILFEYRLTLEEVCQAITSYSDVYCIFSPDCFGQIDVFVDTTQIEPTETLPDASVEELTLIYLEEVVQQTIEEITICGIPGITNMFFLQDKKTKKWYIETENERVKTVKKFRSKKDKPMDSITRFKTILGHPCCDSSTTLSNNVWDIYYTFGIEAVRQYMIDEFSRIMDGINLCHIMILVDKMTFIGTISSVSRYTMRAEESGPFGKASFEETLDNFLNAGTYGQVEPTKGVSASIICGKRAEIGTGLCQLSMNIQKLNKNQKNCSNSSCSTSSSEESSEDE